MLVTRRALSRSRSGGVLRTTRAVLGCIALFSLPAFCAGDGGGCQVNLCGQTPAASTIGCVSLSGNGGTSMYAQFTLPPGLTLPAAASSCGFTGFDWEQTVDLLPDPSPFYLNNGAHLTSASAPFSDPPFGGYAYLESQQPPYLGAYPFFYNPAYIAEAYSNPNSPDACAQLDGAHDCLVPLVLNPGGNFQLLNFVDTPYDQCLLGGALAGTAACAGATAPPGSYLRFTTMLVGVLPGLTPSQPLFQWQWTDSFNGTAAGSIGPLPPPAVTTSLFSIQPGSGAGGITIMSMTGVPSISVGPSLCVPFPVTLGTPAGPSGTYVTLTSSDPSTVSMGPGSVSAAIILIPAGETTPDRRAPQVCGVNFGSATVTASGDGLSSSQAVLVQVTATLSFAPASVTASTTMQTRLTLTLSAPAPAGGVTVNLSSDNPAVATVPAAVFIPANGTSATVPVTAIGGGSTSIHASALPNVPDTAAIVTVPGGATPM